MNARAKGLRIEAKARAWYAQRGFTVIPIFQPKFQPQGPVDFLALGHGRALFVQVRANQWHDLRPCKQFAALHCQGTLIPSFEVVRFDDGKPEPQVRVLE